MIIEFKVEVIMVLVLILSWLILVVSVVVLVLMVKCMLRALQNAEQVFAVRWELHVCFIFCPGPGTASCTDQR